MTASLQNFVPVGSGSICHRFVDNNIEVGEKSIVVAARSFTPQRSKELNKVHVLPAAQADLSELHRRQREKL